MEASLVRRPARRMRFNAASMLHQCCSSGESLTAPPRWSRSASSLRSAKSRGAQGHCWRAVYDCCVGHVQMAHAVRGGEGRARFSSSPSRTELQPRGAQTWLLAGYDLSGLGVAREDQLAERVALGAGGPRRVLQRHAMLDGAVLGRVGVHRLCDGDCTAATPGRGTASLPALFACLLSPSLRLSLFLGLPTAGSARQSPRSLPAEAEPAANSSDDDAGGSPLLCSALHHGGRRAHHLWQVLRPEELDDQQIRLNLWAGHEFSTQWVARAG